MGAESSARWIADAAKDELAGRTAMGKVKLAEQKFPEAIAELEWAVAQKPGPSQARALLAQAYVANKKPEAAEALLKRDIAKDPKDADALVLMGDLQFNLGRADQAEATLKQAIEAKPSWEIPYFKLGSLYNKSGNNQQAAEVYRKGLKQIPDQPGLWLNLGMVEDSLDHFEAAREAYQAVLKAEPRNFVAANNLAALIADAWPGDKEQMEQARRLAEAFRNERDPLLIDTLGWIQFRLGNLDDAVALLEQAASAMPEHPQIRYHLGMAYKAKGDAAKARAELQKAVAQPTAYRGFDEAKRTLASL
jgi:tetratricopeptide (TPR) repeat protein